MSVRLKRRCVAAVHGFGVNPRVCCPVLPLVHEELTYVCCVESQLALVSYEDMGDRVKPMQFFPVACVEQRAVTAMTMHLKSRLLAACATAVAGSSSCSIYTIGRREETWVPAVVASVGLPGTTESYRHVAFCACKKEVLACASKSRIVGIDWRKKQTIFETDLGTFFDETLAISFHPQDPLEVATSGTKGHLQFWRVFDRRLKPRPRLTFDDNIFSTHGWLESALVVAGTAKGSVVCVRDNVLVERFDEAHSDSVRTATQIDGNTFVTLCAAGVACIFRFFFRDTNKVSLESRVSVAQGLLGGRLSFAAPFPDSRGHFLALGTEGASVVDLAGIVLDLTSLSEGKKSLLRESAANSRVAKIVASRQADPEISGDTSSLASSSRKPLVVSCSPKSSMIYVWDWRQRKAFSRVCVCGDDDGGGGGENHKKKTLVSVDVHPSGDELVAGFEDAVVLYHMSKDEMVVMQAISGLKGAVKLAKDSTAVVITGPLSKVKYAPSGRGFGLILGRLVQIYETCDAVGKAGLFQCLFGHGSDVVDLVWDSDDLRLWTIAADGALYEWRTFRGHDKGKAVSRTLRDDSQISWSHLARFAFGGGLVAAGTLGKTQQRLCVWRRGDLEEEEDANKTTTNSKKKYQPRTIIDVEKHTVTSLVCVDASSDFEAALVCGTSSGSLLVYAWTSDVPEAEEVPLLDGPVRTLSFSASGNRLFAACDGGTVVVCDFGFRSSRRIVAEKKVLDFFEEYHMKETVVVDKAVLEAMELKVKCLMKDMDQSKLEAEKKVETLAPTFTKEIEALKVALERQEGLHARELALRDERTREMLDGHGLQLESLKTSFKKELADLEDLYDRKFAIEAARYAEMREDRDTVAERMRNALAEREVALEQERKRLEAEAALKVSLKEKDLEVLEEYLEHAKKQFDVVLRTRDSESDAALDQAKADRDAAKVESKRARNALILENATLKQRATALEMEAHRSRDEVVDSSKALLNEKKLSEAQARDILALRDTLETERQRANAAEDMSKEQAEKISKLEEIAVSVEDRKNKMAATIADNNERIREATEKSRRLDRLLEEAGHSHKSLEAQSGAGTLASAAATTSSRNAASRPRRRT